MPDRIQRRRTAGWRMPDGAVCVDRSNKLWGNPFIVGGTFPEKYGGHAIPDAETAVRLYRTALTNVLHGIKGGAEYNPLWDRFRTTDDARYAIEELRGRDLCCWRRPSDPCHADVLLEVVGALPERVTYNPAELFGDLIAHALEEMAGGQ